jgi:hypothetical protein
MENQISQIIVNFASFEGMFYAMLVKQQKILMELNYTPSDETNKKSLNELIKKFDFWADSFHKMFPGKYQLPLFSKISLESEKNSGTEAKTENRWVGTIKSGEGSLIRMCYTLKQFFSSTAATLLELRQLIKMSDGVAQEILKSKHDKIASTYNEGMAILLDISSGEFPPNEFKLFINSEEKSDAEETGDDILTFG